MSRKIYIIIAMVFTVVLSVSTFFIIRNHIDSAKQNEVYDNLAEMLLSAILSGEINLWKICLRI